MCVRLRHHCLRQLGQYSHFVLVQMASKHRKLRCNRKLNVSKVLSLFIHTDIFSLFLYYNLANLYLINIVYFIDTHMCFSIFSGRRNSLHKYHLWKWIPHLCITRNNKPARFASVGRLPFVLIRLFLLTRGGPENFFYENRVSNSCDGKLYFSETQDDRECQRFRLVI